MAHIASLFSSSDREKRQPGETVETEEQPAKLPSLNPLFPLTFILLLIIVGAAILAVYCFRKRYRARRKKCELQQCEKPTVRQYHRSESKRSEHILLKPQLTTIIEDTREEVGNASSPCVNASPPLPFSPNEEIFVVSETPEIPDEKSDPPTGIEKRFPYNDKIIEIDQSRLKILDVIGVGTLSIVSRGELEIDILEKTSGVQQKIVAVKELRNPDGKNQRRNFMYEVSLLAYLGPHKNVVHLIGAITKQCPLRVVLEYCDGGNLQNFLRYYKQNYVPVDNAIEDPEKALTRCHLITLAKQVADGMKFIHSKGCIHRNLAAQNILLCDKWRTAKITDFSLGNDVMERGMDEAATRTTRVPWAWYAPEVLESFTCLPASDVWSYGVLLWEILSFGERLYGESTWDFTFLEQLKDGQRLEKPPCADEHLYAIMISCWQWEADDRPTFEMLSSYLDNSLIPVVDSCNFTVCS